MLVLLVATVILPLVYTGPLWPVEGLAVMGNCRKWWWTNLLYINNFVDANELVSSFISLARTRIYYLHLVCRCSYILAKSFSIIAS